jgi:mono/diheme cytochrome c family protein
MVVTMNKLQITGLFCIKKFAAVFGFASCICSICIATASEDLLEHGKYVFYAAGCISCHTRDRLMAGGRPLDTPFGIFYPPNITPQSEYGIGAWTEKDFVRALREGMSPQGQDYYPAFPYPSYTMMTRQDMHALYAYLMTLPASSREVRPHSLHWPFSSRSMISYWKAGRFSPGEFLVDPEKPTLWNRGAYLASALGHCSECHTPRDYLGAPRSDRYLAGTCMGPEGRRVPNITPDRETGIGDWTYEELRTFLKAGRKPDGSYTDSLMAEVLGTSCMRLTEYDLDALATYLQSLPPISNDLDTLCSPFDDTFMYE